MIFTRWRCPMPREEPEAGKAHVIISIKFAGGGRAEYSGQLPEDIARSAIKDTINRAVVAMASADSTGVPK